MKIGANILIAGCGDIGAGVAKRMVQAGHHVTVIRRSPYGFPEGAEGIQLDLAMPVESGILPDADLILICLSASEAGEAAYRAAYVTAPEHLLADRRGEHASQVLFVSSTGVYHQDDGSEVDETTPIAPTHYRGRTLLEGESAVHRLSASACTVRFSGIYGPGRGRFLRKVRDGFTPTIDERLYTNRIHREDCIGVLEFLIQASLAGEPLAPCYVASDTRSAAQSEVVAWMRGQMGMPALQGPAPSVPIRLRGKQCSSRLLQEKGYRFRYPEYTDGYAELIRNLDSG